MYIYNILKLHSFNLLRRIVITILILIIKIFWIQLFSIPLKNSSKHVNHDLLIHTQIPHLKKNDDNSNHTENNTESLQGETSVEPNTNPTDKTQQSPLPIPESSYSELFTGPIQNSSIELHQQIIKSFFHQNKLKLKLNIHDYNITVELKQRIKQNENKNWNIINWYNNWINLILNFNMKIFHRKRTQLIPSTSKKVPPQEVPKDLDLFFFHHYSSFITLH